MNGVFLLLVFLIQSAAQTGCCSSKEFNSTVENAFISCPTNVSCDAECYHGFIFPTGHTNGSFRCQKGVWTPGLSSCKAIPVVSVTYSTTWNFTDVVPFFCKNILTHLDASKSILEDTFANQCEDLAIHRSVEFTYMTLSFMIKANFSVEYSDFANWDVFNRCTNYTISSLRKSPVIWTIFDNVTCNWTSLDYTILKELYIRDREEFCFNGTEIHKVTPSMNEEFELYCDIHLPVSTSEIPKEEITSNRSILENTTLINKTETEWFDKELSSVWGFKSFLYIASAGGGVLLITIIVIVVVCLQKKENFSTKSLKELEMTCNIYHYNHGFKGELIENTLYQSADDVICCLRDQDDIK